jgi:hypothetical protein
MRMSHEFEVAIEAAIEMAIKRMQVYPENPHQAHVDAIKLAYINGWSEGFVAACDAMTKDQPE